MGKYKNDGQPYSKKVPKRDARKAAEVWGEGNQALTDLLEECIENGILTRACCEGRIKDGRLSEFPYISFKKQNGISSYLLEQVKNEPSLQYIFVDRNPISKEIDIALYGEYQQRGEFFRAIHGYVQDYVHYNGPIEAKTIKGFFKSIASTRYQGKRIKEESIFEKILNLMETTSLQTRILYNARLKLFDIGKFTLPPHEVEAYLKDIANKENQKQTNSVIKAVKSICENATIGINEISEVARKLHSKLEQKKTQLDERDK